jgi:phosphoribosylformimino-5-aminoimidazole carboxamide ribotide isomerase
MSKFEIYPAIDMRGGKCVRLLQGDYSKETVYGDSPVDMATQFASEGAQWIHMVDLDGAKAAKRVNDEFVLGVKKKLDVRVQIGGGIRSEADVAYYLENGIDRVILGSAAISNPEFVKKMLKEYGARIAIGIDARDGYVATEGWVETSTIKATEQNWLMLVRKHLFSRIFLLMVCCLVLMWKELLKWLRLLEKV